MGGASQVAGGGQLAPPMPSIMRPACPGAPSCQDDDAVCPLTAFNSSEANRIFVLKC